jgi:hypothetical protein
MQSFQAYLHLLPAGRTTIRGTNPTVTQAFTAPGTITTHLSITVTSAGEYTNFLDWARTNRFQVETIVWSCQTGEITLDFANRSMQVRTQVRQIREHAFMFMAGATRDFTQMTYKYEVPAVPVVDNGPPQPDNGPHN